MGPIARGQITLVDLSDIISQSTAPANPTEGMLWMNTGVTPPVLMVYREGKWVQQNDFKQDPEYNVIKETLKTNTSGIDVLKDEIKLKVSQTEVTNTVTTEIGKIEIGGTNLWIESQLQAGYESSGNIINSSSAHQTMKILTSLNSATKLTWQVWNPNKIANTSNINRFAFFNSDKVYMSSITVEKLSGAEYQTGQVAIPSGAKYARLGMIQGASGGSKDSTIKIKIEGGTKTTDWTPAPEDTQTQITEINDKTSEITQSLDGITSRVSSVESETRVNKNKWLVRQYAKNLGSNRIPTMADLMGLSVENQWEISDKADLFPYQAIVDYKLFTFSTRAYVSENKSIALNITSDDGINFYLNGDSIGSRAASGTTSITMNLKVGWNDISILLYENSGGERLTFDKKLSDNVDLMSYSSVEDISSRVKEAEQKITDSAIVNTVKNSQTNGKDTFVQTSTLEQTTESITASFKSSGGENLVYNSTGKGGIVNWSKSNDSGVSLGTGTNSAIGSGVKEYLFLDTDTITTEKHAYSKRFELAPNTKYTLSVWIHTYTKSKGLDLFVLTSTSTEASSSSTDYTSPFTLVNSAQTDGQWKKYVSTFTTPANTKSGLVRIDNNGYNASGTNSNRVHWNALVLTKGDLERPWSAHPTETYDGITTIDNNGIRVNSSNANTYTQMSSTGFYLKKNDGTSLLTADANGLALTGKITVTSGSSVPSSSLTGTVSDSLLSQDIKDQIQQGVSAKDKVDNLNIGGRNLARKSCLRLTNSATGSFNSTTNTWTLTATPGSTSWGRGLAIIDSTEEHSIQIPFGKSVVYSFEIKTSKNINWNMDVNNKLIGGSSSTNDNDASGNRKNSARAIEANKWTKCWQYVENTDLAKNPNKLDIRDASSYFGIVTTNETENITFEIRNFQVEFGNVATDWTPAPEDVDATIAAAQSTADSVSSTVDAGKDKWGQAYDRVAQWAYGAVTGSTTIDGGLIQTNTILAEKIAIGDFLNYSDLQDSTASRYGFTKQADEAGGAWYLKNGMARDIFISGYHTCNGGESFRLKFDMSTTIKGNSTSGSTSESDFKGTALGLYCYDGTGKSIGIVYSERITNTTKLNSSSSVTIPTATRKFKVFWQTESWGNWSGEFKVRNVQVIKMSTGELIVNGSITTEMVNANGISASKIKAGSLTSTNNKSVFNLDNGSFNIGATSDASYLKYDTTNGLELKGKMTFTSGTTFPDSVLNDKIKLGGTNIVKNTKAPKDKSYWTYRPDNLNIARSILLDEDVFCITQTGTGEKYAGTERYRLEPNTQYTFSAKVYLDENVKGLTAYWLSRSSGNTSEYQYIINLFSGWNATKKAWVKVSKTFTTNSSEYEGYLRMDHAGSSVSTGANTLWFTEVQIEKGNTVSDWSPAASEVISNIEGAQGSADNANKVAEEANSTANQAAGIVKDLTTIDELNGNATVIDGGKILTGSITAEKIKTYDFAVYNKVTKDRTFYINDIGDVEITGELKSNNFDSSNGSLGYKVTPDGLAHFNQAIINGEIKLPNSGMTNYGSRNQSNPNLLLNSNLRRGRESWAGINQIQIDVDYSMGMDGSASVVIESYDRTTDGWLGPTQRFGTNNFNGKTLTASLWYYVRNIETFDSDFTLEVKSTRTGQAYDVGIASLNVTKDTMVQGKWTKISVTFVVPSDVTVIYIYPWVRRNGMIWITNMKVEEGSEATPWCLSESEMGEQIRIWSGASYEQRHDAPFRVLQNGNVNIKGGYFDGVFSGTINLANNRLTLSSTEGYVHNNSQGNPINVISPSTTYFTTNFAVKALNGSTYFGVSQDGAGSVEVNTDTFKIGSNLTFSSQKANLLKIGSIGHTLSLNDLNLLTMTSKNSGVGKDFRFERSSGNVSIEVAGSLEVTNSVNVGKVQMIKREADATNPGIDFIIL